MKAPIFASILCLFSVTVLAAPPPTPPKRMCKTQFATPKGPIVIDSVSGECHTLQIPVFTSNLKVIQPNSGIITAFGTSKCDTKPFFDLPGPIQLPGPKYISSFITRC